MEQPLWWMLTLVVPAVAMVMYWYLARRQARAASADLRRRLDEERRITAHVSHRLRNPLTVIYGFSETLVDASFADPSEIAKVAAILSAEALDVTRTVEDLVTTKEIERGSIEIRARRFDPSEEIERVVTPFRRLGSPISIEAWSGTAFSDPLRFRQVVQNLVSNAVRHGGPEVAVVADIAGSVFECTVADDGPGLPAGVASRLFTSSPSSNRGARSETDAALGDDADGEKESRRRGSDGSVRVDADNLGGLGLGLGVAIAMAEELGGELTYEHTDGVTAFRFTLPTEEWPGPLVPIRSAPGAPDAPGVMGDDLETSHQPAITESDAGVFQVRFDGPESVQGEPDTDGADESDRMPSLRGTSEDVPGP